MPLLAYLVDSLSLLSGRKREAGKVRCDHSEPWKLAVLKAQFQLLMSRFFVVIKNVDLIHTEIIGLLLCWFVVKPFLVALGFQENKLQRYWFDGLNFKHADKGTWNWMDKTSTTTGQCFNVNQINTFYYNRSGTAKAETYPRWNSLKAPLDVVAETGLSKRRILAILNRSFPPLQRSCCVLSNFPLSNVCRVLPTCVLTGWIKFHHVTTQRLLTLHTCIYGPSSYISRLYSLVVAVSVHFLLLSL